MYASPLKGLVGAADVVTDIYTNDYISYNIKEVYLFVQGVIFVNYNNDPVINIPNFVCFIGVPVVLSCVVASFP